MASMPHSADPDDMAGARTRAGHSPESPAAPPDASIEGWADVIAPSGGRLSTATVAVEAEEDPCTLPPSGGYRGPEHHTYRVEIH